jgi:hypothetical protein
MFDIIKKQNSIAIIILVASVFLVFNSVLTKEIRSTKEGGNWCEPTTWLSKEIPGESDNVIIDGLVMVNCPAFSDTLKISPEGKLFISPKDSIQCHLIIIDEKDGKKGQIQNLGLISVEEKKPKTTGGK